MNDGPDAKSRTRHCNLRPVTMPKVFDQASLDASNTSVPRLFAPSVFDVVVLKLRHDAELALPYPGGRC